MGRPRIISSPEEFDELVDSYVAEKTSEEKPLTLTGMILALGLSSRQSLDEYLARDEFSDSVKRAKLIIENQYEERLAGNNAAGPIFALKNFGWKDKQEIDQNNTHQFVVDPTPESTVDEWSSKHSPQ